MDILFIAFDLTLLFSKICSTFIYKQNYVNVQLFKYINNKLKYILIMNVKFNFVYVIYICNVVYFV